MAGRGAAAETEVVRPAVEEHGRPQSRQPVARLWLIAGAMLCLYVVWGSTYLGIKWAVEGFPPLFVAAVRALVAGGLIYGVARARGAERPTARQWRAAAVVGGLLLLGGNGLVTMASQWVASGVCALIVGLLPVWMVLLDRGSPARRSGLTWAGVAMGLAGVVLLIGPRILESTRGGAGHGGAMQLVGMGMLVCSSLSWATGSLYSRRAERAGSAFAGTGMQLLCGGGLLLVVSAVSGEPWRMSAEAMFASWRPGLSLLYLTLFGTLLGYTAYIWLLDVASPVLVSSYAFVNPAVAVLLGAALGGEKLTTQVVVATAVIVAGVGVIVIGGRKKREEREEERVGAVALRR